MKKQNKRRTNRVRNLIVVCTLSAIILTVTTYAWFIGMQSVNVSSFDIEIASADSLLLSLDGNRWTSTITLTKDTLDDLSYDNNTNSWGGSKSKGIFPVSSVGQMDKTASRMKLYEKASLTTTTGGYRLLASRVKNYAAGATEQDGYVVFDLFVRNFSGTQYLKKLDELDEEAIYLTTDSEVTVAESGVSDAGIENSVRVAFAQIGRVDGTTTDVSTITSINCTGDVTTTTNDGVTTTTGTTTGICRTAQIWEPNDKKHVASAINWYDTSCLTRLSGGDDVTQVASYGSAKCTKVLNNTAYETYAINNDINSTDNIDIYDGTDYNTYIKSTRVPTCTGGTVPTTQEKCLSSYGEWNGTSCVANNSAYCKAINGTYSETTGLLQSYPYFTDTMKMLTGTDRPTFITLAPNSITKLRIYVYIEGQDIDNYDFASIGKKIAVKFGFTKERFTETDITYSGPTLTVDETEPITLSPSE